MLETHDELLKRWASLPEQSVNFIKDGIIDTDKWDKANCKVLLLLKEAYSHKSPTGFDLRRTIRDQWGGIKKDGKDNTWINSALWCYVAQTLSSMMPDADKNNPMLNEALLQAAIINVKKSGGRSSSDMEEIEAIARRDGDLIKKQIAIVAPDIVICGYTWKAVKHLYKDAVRIFPRVWLVNGIYFINFWHPANQFPRDLNYFSLVTLLREKENHRLLKNSF